MLASTTTAGLKEQCTPSLQKQKKMQVLIYIQSVEMRSDRKRSLEMHVGAHCNAKCELTYLQLPAGDRITQDAC